MKLHVHKYRGARAHDRPWYWDLYRNAEAAKRREPISRIEVGAASTWGEAMVLGGAAMETAKGRRR